MKSRFILLAAMIFAISAVTAISFAQRTRDTADKPITGDFKITIKNTTSGQTSQSTTLIKGKRERSESSMGGMGAGNSVTITQCDMRRTIQINDGSRKYFVNPMDADDEATSGNTGNASTPSRTEPSRRGGVVSMTVNTVDTGERKEMFGVTARHLKRTVISETSPDACYQNKIRIDTDGWYINLEYGLNCGTSNKPPRMGPPASGGCRDRYDVKNTGPSNLGFPLVETMTMYGEGGQAMFTRTQEVVDLSRQPLDAALFDVPAGYTEVKTQQELSGAPSMADVMAMQRQQSGDTHAGNPDSSMSRPSTNANTAAKVRVGVVEFNNKTKSTVSTDSLRQQLIAMLAGNGIDAVALNASSPSEAAIEAKAKECSYILFTDVATLKAASSGKKIGGFLGRAAGVDTGAAGKSEARLDFRLIATGSTSPTVQSSASSKEDSDQASISAAIESEAKAIASAVGKM
ncbi:MAG TPA: hypothetical protein VK475_01655 [Pyrinomonadaceae bacterium]|nr:hypothetical protein [Pyrinomonadaceae bacterium]